MNLQRPERAQAAARLIRTGQMVELGHVLAPTMPFFGTQLDAFPHQTIGDQVYNCVDLPSISGRSGFTEMGVHTIGTVMTRGVLIDVAGLKGVPVPGDDYEITVADLEQALSRQK